MAHLGVSPGPIEPSSSLASTGPTPWPGTGTSWQCLGAEWGGVLGSRGSGQQKQFSWRGQVAGKEQGRPLGTQRPLGLAFPEPQGPPSAPECFSGERWEETGKPFGAQPAPCHPPLLPASCSLSSPWSPQRAGPLAGGNQGPALQCGDLAKQGQAGWASCSGTHWGQEVRRSGWGQGEGRRKKRKGSWA